jgi:FlaA1/EpsC-like NDP-sugar epimerase
MTNDPRIDVWIERACNLATVVVSVTVAFLLRFDFSIGAGVWVLVKEAIPIAIMTKLPVFDWVGMYRGVREFASLPDLFLVWLGNIIGSVLFAAASMFLIGPSMPRSIIVIDAVLCFVGTGLVRFSVRICNHTFFTESLAKGRSGILIYGAGAAGADLVREIRSDQFAPYQVAGFLDDDPLKQRAFIMGVPVLGTGREARAVVDRLNRSRSTVQEIVIAMPRATGSQMQEALANCHAAQLPFRTVSGIADRLNGKISSAQGCNLPLQDLLGRPPVRLDYASVREGIVGRSVLVTGAAGSIGSELCRQIADLRPACLVAFDQAESDLFRIENELRAVHPKVELAVVLGDIRNRDRISDVIDRYAVDSIFHAAAYKHVPLMEANVLEAVRNNILGTWNLVRAAGKARSLLMISSDKAVNPICVMGATKRVCERIVSAFGQESRNTRCTSVRFGNVLGSNGSVVPIFQAQIAAGGPLKITHPNVRRYFMTISEAVSLVLQASTKSQGSEIFILDMGEPIRIVDLAENMIRLAGFVPYKEIDIHFTGLRPGEKLVEELSRRESKWDSCEDKMRVIHDQPLSWSALSIWVDQLLDFLSPGNDSEIIGHLQSLVPEYTPSSKRAISSRPEPIQAAEQPVSSE